MKTNELDLRGMATMMNRAANGLREPSSTNWDTAEKLDAYAAVLWKLANTKSASPWPFCANDGTCSCAKFHDNPDGCERRAERGITENKGE